jgi:tetratricopeptide (TPR) repeat protein
MMFAAAASAQSSQEAAALNDRGNVSLTSRDYEAAETLFRQAAAMFGALGPQFEAHRAGVLLNVGQTLNGQGKRREGAAVYEQALEIHRRTLGAKHINTITNINYLASTYLLLGDMDRAQPLFAEALAVARGVCPNHIQYATALAGMSNIRSRQGKYVEALSLGEEALALSIKLDGDDGLDTALMYSEVAEVHRVARHNARALPLYRKARAIYEKELGPDHPRVASVLSQEGLILMDDNKLTLAEQAMTRALDSLRRSCPGCMVEEWIAESNLALLRLKQGNFEESDRLFSHVLSLQETCLPRPSRDMALTLQSLAAVRKKEKRYEDAVRLNKRAEMIMAFQ